MSSISSYTHSIYSNWIEPLKDTQMGVMLSPNRRIILVVSAVFMALMAVSYIIYRQMKTAKEDKRLELLDASSLVQGEEKVITPNPIPDAEIDASGVQPEIAPQKVRAGEFLKFNVSEGIRNTFGELFGDPEVIDYLPFYNHGETIDESELREVDTLIEDPNPITRGYVKTLDIEIVKAQTGRNIINYDEKVPFISIKIACNLTTEDEIDALSVSDNQKRNAKEKILNGETVTYINVITVEQVPSMLYWDKLPRNPFSRNSLFQENTRMIKTGEGEWIQCEQDGIVKPNIFGSFEKITDRETGEVLRWQKSRFDLLKSILDTGQGTDFDGRIWFIPDFDKFEQHRIKESEKPVG